MSGGGIAISTDKHDTDAVRQKLEHMHDSGIALYLDGEPATPSSIAGRCVQEDTLYMADYVIDDKGILKELRYDRIFEK